MKNFRTLVLSFVVGGIYAAIGQLFLMLYTMLLGPESPWVGPLALVTLGVLAFVMYVTGLHQKIAPLSGLGSVMIFNGLAAGVAATFEGAADEADSNGKGAKAGTMLIVYVVGFGGLLCMLISIFAFFALQ